MLYYLQLAYISTSFCQVLSHSPPYQLKAAVVSLLHIQLSTAKHKNMAASNTIADKLLVQYSMFLRLVPQVPEFKV